MITWSPTAETFCRYARRRRAARRWLLAEPWRGVLAATVREAQAGDEQALRWLQVCAPGVVL